MSSGHLQPPWLFRKKANPSSLIMYLPFLDFFYPGIYNSCILLCNGRLPYAPGRIWYEADFDYTGGFRNDCRLIFSNDGLLFVTYDHYETFIEIVLEEVK